MLDFSERIAMCTIFSNVDLRKGRATPFGLFEFLRMTSVPAASDGRFGD
jgi:hypothetical protein